jgi:hypothetical protein
MNSFINILRENWEMHGCEKMYIERGIEMVGMIVSILGLFWLLYCCNEITAEKFEKALRKQKETWNSR